MSQRNILVAFFFVSLVALAFSPLPQAKTLRAMARSTSSLGQISPNLYAHRESQLSALIRDELPLAIANVEALIGGKFAAPPTLYLPSSLDEFERYCVARRSLGCQIQGKIFISPRLIEQPNGQVLILLTHELIHLYFDRRLSFWQTVALPVWFNEGMATMASLPLREFCQAEQDIRSAISFTPSESGSLIFPEYHSSFGLTRGAFYRQSAAFLAYLSQNQPQQFEQFLKNILAGQNFARSFASAFGNTVDAIWQGYRKSIAPKNCPKG